MFSKIRLGIANLPLKTKLCLTLLTVILPLFAAFLFGLQWVEQIYTDYLYRSVAERLMYSGQEISAKLQSAEDLSQLILSRDSIQSDMRILKEGDNSQQRRFANAELRQLLTSYSDGFRDNAHSYINLYSNTSVISSDPYASSLIPDEIHEQVQQAARMAEGAPVWIADYASTYGLFLGRQIRQIEHLSLQPLGEIIINVDIDQLIAQTSAAAANSVGSYSYLLLSNDSVLYHSGGLTYEQAQYVQSVAYDRYKIITIDGSKYFSVFRGLPYYGWDYVCLLAYDDVVAALTRARVTFIGLMLALTLLMLVLAFHSIDSTTVHFKILARRMLALGEDVSSFPHETYDYSMRKDEAGILHQQFDQMVLKLEALIQTNYINELMKKEAQLNALENQINPHFLYNTLESVNWRAKAAGATDISEMVQALAALLRVTLNKNNSAYSLGQELDLIRSYMVIQHYRFDDRLQYTITAPQQLCSLPIPRLLVQPLVENAIHYGLEDNIEDCEIRITVEQQQQKLILRVWNTGSAFPPDLLNQLRAQTIQSKGHGIALLNIAERLQLTYGEEGCLRLYNQEDWAIAEITLPIREESLC